MIGSHVCEFYAQDPENEVLSMDNLSRSHWFESGLDTVRHNWKYLEEKYPNVFTLKADVRDVAKAHDNSSMSNWLKDCDLVVHTAANPGVPTSVKHPQEDFFNNAWGTVSVLEGMRKWCDKATFVYASTNKVYGENVDRIKITEGDTRYFFAEDPSGYDSRDIADAGIDERLPIDQAGHTPYGCSKYVGDLYAQEYHHIYGMKTGVFRMSCIYGERQWGFEDQGWFAWFIIAHLTGQEINIFGDGKQVRDALHASDVARAYDMFHKSNYKHAVYNLGGGPENSTSLEEFMRKLEDMSGMPVQRIYRSWRPSDQKIYVTDTFKLRDSLGWEPTISIDDGIDRLYAWVEANKKLFR